MRVMVAIAMDLLREAVSRKWFLGLALVLTALILMVALAMRMDVVDGALAATRLFGQDMGTEIRSAEVALRPVFEATAYTVFYGGLVFGILACSDFGPELLSPGRIEHLLSLPVRRHELLFGTFLGVMTLCVLGTLYGAGGFLLVLSVKSGVWSVKPLVAALIATVSFSAIYAGMLTTAVFVRSAPLCAAVGAALFAVGVFAGHRATIAALFEPGVGRSSFLLLTAALPRVSQLADASAAIAVGEPVAGGTLARVLGGTAIFGAALLAVGAWKLERKDF